MKVITYNLNGIRSAIQKGLPDWLRDVNPDVFCVQETKAQQEDVPAELFLDLGYTYQHWHSAQKKGYSGVATFSKVQPDLVQAGCGIPAYDQEGRILRTDFGDVTILNCYFPSGTTGDVRQDFKMKFLVDFHTWVRELRKTRPNLIILGDYNIAHTEKDIHDPKGNKNSSGFLPEERAWMSSWLDDSFTDSYRHLNPEAVAYSWWSFRAGARGKNKGWRIDYQCVSQPLVPRLKEARHFPEAVHSDHCGLMVELSG